MHSVNQPSQARALWSDQNSDAEGIRTPVRGACRASRAPRCPAQHCHLPVQPRRSCPEFCWAPLATARARQCHRRLEPPAVLLRGFCPVWPYGRERWGTMALGIHVCKPPCDIMYVMLVHSCKTLQVFTEFSDAKLA